ncbi:protein transporter Sec31 [Streptomyces sp. MS06]|uniref:protein transporter Sec31 n=1 Tax=Streptomyces sp. MS06 TaxID=3385974 RepID=UPI0039A3D554
MKTTRTELVPHTIDGKTRLVPITVPVPAPPRDWDRIILTGVTTTAALVVAASVTWSTASIGDLLTRIVIAPAAYGAAAVFDLAWIACMAVEWLARYDRQQAALPRRMGHSALAVAMLAVAAHGYLLGHLVIGIVGAVVSGLAKSLWTVVLHHQAPPLDDRTRAWIEQELADAGASLALIPARRRVQRAHALVAAERAALPSPDQSGQDADDPDATPEPATAGPMTIKDAVRTALDSGIREPDKVLTYVRKVADANAREDTVARYIRLAG